MVDVIVIGAGPAGMTAALNCLRAEKSVLVLESESFGGQIALSPRVENFPTVNSAPGSELMDKLYDQIVEWGAQIELECVEKIDKTPIGFKVTTDYGEHECLSVIIATGVKHREIGVEREDELVGNGVSYCAICDGAFYSGEEVAVIGDANTALQYSLLLSGYCKTVHICTLFDRFFGDRVFQEKILEKQKENVRIYHNLSLEKFVGEDELTGLVFRNTKDDSEFALNVKAVFICIGQVPNNDAFKDIVELDKNGYIVSDESCATSCEGIFVAGDCRTKSVRQLITAASDGSIAAFNACQYIETKMNA